MEIQGLLCCAFAEISGLSEHSRAKDALLELTFGEVDTHPDDIMLSSDFASDFASAMLFTEAGTGKYATRFAQYIEKYNLGRIVRIPSFVNGNTKRRIRAFIWHPDENAIRHWYDALPERVAFLQELRDEQEELRKADEAFYNKRKR